MKNKSVVILALSLIIVILLLVVGCANNNGGSKKGDQSAKQDKIEYPTKPIQLIVSWSTGGSSDLTCRKMAEVSEKQLGKPLVVVNKTGGAGTVGTAEVVSAKPDGYTLVYAKIGPVSIQPLRGATNYTMEDLEPIAGTSASPILLIVRKDSQWKSVNDIVEYSKKTPSGFRFGMASQGGAPHLAMELFAKKAGIKLSAVAFNGSSESIAALLGNHIDGVLVDPPGEAMEYIKSGDVRAIASFEPERLTMLPDVPTFKEVGYDVVVRVWSGIAAPKGLPGPVKEKLVSGFEKIVNDPKVLDFLKGITDVPMYLKPDDFKKLWKQDEERFKVIIEELGLKQSKK